MTEFSDATQRRLGLLFLALSMVLLGLTLHAFARESAFVRHARPGRGVVIEVQRGGRSPTIRYTDARGDELSFSPRTRAAGERYSVGNTVDLLYGDMPGFREAKIHAWSHIWGSTVFFGCAYSIVSIFAVLTLAGIVRWAPLKRVRLSGG